MRAVFFPMVALLALAGAYCVWQGADIIQLERGWATVISGAVAFSSGLVIIALGLLVDEDYRMCDASGAGQPGLHYLGPHLRAQRWEGTAVPELREHAAALADRLVSRAG